MARQREDYENSTQLVANLTKQLEMAAEEAETHRRQVDEVRRRSLLIGQSNEQNRKQVCSIDFYLFLFLMMLSFKVFNRKRP